jgi:hypothetical protein
MISVAVITVDDDYVEGVRLSLWILAIIGLILHHPRDIWTWRTMVRWYWQSSLTIIQGKSSSSKAEKLCKEMVNLSLRSIFVYTPKRSLTCRKILRHGADGFTSPPKEGVLRIFIAVKNSSALAGIEAANLGSNGKHTSHYTTEYGHYCSSYCTD